MHFYEFFKFDKSYFNSYLKAEKYDETNDLKLNWISPGTLDFNL